MTKINSRNAQLKSALGAMAPKERVKEVLNIPKEDTKNRQGFAAYSLPEELRLISMLNTLKVQEQFYRTENKQMQELRDLIERIGFKDPYFVAQCIKYSRCMGEGMRDINNIAAALLAPFASGQEWAKRFYSLYNKKTQLGGCIFRADDMNAIKTVFSALNTPKLSAAMKVGFRNTLEALDAYQLAKYAKTTRDIANLVHPNPEKSKAVITLTGKDRDKFLDGKGYDESASEITVKVLDAIMSGITVSADTWEVANSEAGQEVAKAVKAGKITAEEGKKILAQAKDQNFQDLLKEGKLGVLAALRNIRQILQYSDQKTVDLLCALLSNPEKIRQGKIMPYQIDIAYEVLNTEFRSYDKYTQVRDALVRGYETSVPNLAEALPGKTLVILDCSGSMSAFLYDSANKRRLYSSCLDKASLIAATIAKATGADVIRFGSRAEWTSYNKNHTVFDIAQQFAASRMGCTYLNYAWDLARVSHKDYDRVIILSDNECNSMQRVSTSYKQYVHDVCSPYVYCCDMAAYGTTPLAGDKVNYYCGYGYKLFDDIASNEFNPMQHIEKIRKVVI